MALSIGDGIARSLACWDFQLHANKQAALMATIDYSVTKVQRRLVSVRATSQSQLRVDDSIIITAGRMLPSHLYCGIIFKKETSKQAINNVSFCIDNVLRCYFVFGCDKL